MLLYLGAALGGVGAGAVYGTCVGNAVRWFPDRRGLAAGLTVAGFGAGSALSIIPIQDVIASRGYETAFLWFGLAQGLIVVVTAWAAAPLRPAAMTVLPAPVAPRTIRARLRPARDAALAGSSGCSTSCSSWSTRAA